MHLDIHLAIEKASNRFSLTNTEREIVRLITEGHSPLEISIVRDRSIETTRTQIKKIMRKFDVNRMSKIAPEIFGISTESTS